MESPCQALNLSDSKRCTSPAVHAQNLFCPYHAKQCYGLYRGYKIRNARLDALRTNPPEYLKEKQASDVPLYSLDFLDLDSEETLRQVHDHLFQQYALLERVIRARELHHSRFFSLNLDYGHQAYLDKLKGEKFMVLRALERLERRSTEVLYEKQKWYEWVRACQEKEESQRLKEKEKVKKEAIMFKRHFKEVQARIEAKRKREDARRQEEFLEQAYRERMSEEEEASWDPIEDVVRNERADYLNLMRCFLWMDLPREDILPAVRSLQIDGHASPPKQSADMEKTDPLPTPTNAGNETTAVAPSKSSSTNKSKRKKKGKSVAKEPSTRESLGGTASEPTIEKDTVETKEMIADRLRQGVDFDTSVGGVFVLYDRDHLVETLQKAAPWTSSEIETVLSEVSEIKQLLFCRLLISHTSLLPAALKAESIADFLENPDISETDLRDVTLKLAQPGLQEIRDACADLFRGHEELDEEDSEDEIEEVDLKKQKEDEIVKKMFGPSKERRYLTGKFLTEREKQKREMRKMHLQDNEALIDLGQIDEQERNKKMRVRICGKEIWNYASEKSLPRKGWLHFSIIAKHSTLGDATKLCRNWEEFFELRVLTTFGYFPAPGWWGGGMESQHMTQLGFIPYRIEGGAQVMTKYNQTGSRGGGPRAHSYLECRNFICAHMRRNDPVTHRFIRYVSMNEQNMYLLVRDGKTGKIVAQSDGEDRWLVRVKHGMTRASKNEWEVIREVNESFIEEYDDYRNWHLDFNDYYDIYIWDTEPGDPVKGLIFFVINLLIKAHRIRNIHDMFTPCNHILQTLFRDKETKRVRDLRDGEGPALSQEIKENNSLYVLEETESGMIRGVPGEAPPHMFYNDVDALEDAVLFPEVDDATQKEKLYEPISNALAHMEKEEMTHSLARFVYDLDSDEELEDVVGEEMSGEDDDGLSDDLDEESDEGEILSDDGDEAWVDDDDDDIPPEEAQAAMETARRLILDGPRSLEDMVVFRLLQKESANPSVQPQSPLQHREAEIADYWLSIPEESLRRPPSDMQWPGKSKARAAGTEFGGVEEDFEEHMERSRGRIFRQTFHEADLEPGAQSRHLQVDFILTRLGFDVWSNLDTRVELLETLMMLEVHPRIHAHVSRDITRAFATVQIFYDDSFFQTPIGMEVRNPHLLDQVRRAKQRPNRRSQVMIDKRPAKFWKEWDSVPRRTFKEFEANYPFEWDLLVRPTIARLYKAGVIKPAAEGLGQAILGRDEPDGRPDLFFDFRAWHDEGHKSHLSDPDPLPSLLSRAQTFVKRHSDSTRFSLLRMYSPPHFWPLMVGYWNRETVSFHDSVGRAWQWKFLPKDVPFADWSAHNIMAERLKPFKKQLKVGQQTFVKRDCVIVMSEDPMELKRLTVGAVYAISTRPWLREVDPWKSFFNVDIKFLEELDGVWWE